MSIAPNADQQAAPVPFQFRLRTLLIVIACFAIFFSTSGFGLVGFYYPRAIDNDPLIAPVRVLSVQNDRLHLEDDRVIVVDMPVAPLDELVEESDGCVDIEIEDGSKYVEVYAKTRSWICGTPWVRLVNIPLIPVDVPINHRLPIATGRVIPGPQGVVADGRR